MEIGGKILADHYGGIDAPNYMDYYLRKIELSVNYLIDNVGARRKTEEDALTPERCEEIKAQVS